MNIIEQLRSIQQVDLKIRERSEQISSKETHLNNLRTQLQKHVDKIADLNTQRQESQVNLNQRDLDLQSKEEDVRLFQERLSEVSNNRDYTTMLAQIASKKSERSVIEDSILKLQEIIESLDGDVATEQAAHQQLEQEISEEQERIRADVENLQKECEVFEKEKSALVTGLSREDLELYNRLFNKFGVEGLAGVSNGYCLGCYSSLTPQLLEELKLHQDRIVRCSSCSRILYLDDEQPDQEESSNTEAPVAADSSEAP